MGNNSNQWVKHTIAYFSVWLFLLIRVPAQSIAPSTVDTAAINQAYAIGFGLLTVNNDSAKAYSQKIISQSRRLNYPYGLARGYALAGAVMRNRGEFDSSIYYAQKALTIFETQSRPDGTASVYNLLALTYKRMGDAQKVKPLRQKALKYAEMA
ncbi:MAG TPA: tetratricopeptide repeat protein, partial [Hymenobacter sp.]|nr:tetratricopeptide repeat protein [Hymenobacter sp.]